MPKANDIPRCVAIVKRTGRRCTMIANLHVGPDGRPLCVWHSPDHKGRADAMRKRGGREGAKARWQRAKRPAPLRGVADVPIWTSWAADAVAAGDISPKHAQEITRACLAFLKAVQALDLEQQVRALRTELGRLKKGGRE